MKVIKTFATKGNKYKLELLQDNFGYCIKSYKNGESVGTDNLGTSKKSYSYKDFTFIKVVSNKKECYQIYNNVEDYGLIQKGTTIEECKTIVDNYLNK